MATSARIEELEKKFAENPKRYFAPLANEYRKAGDIEQAIAICRSHLPQQPGHMSGHIVFGQALFESKQYDEAKTVFQTALSLDPENLIALRHLGDIARLAGEFASARDWYQRVLDADPRNSEIAAQIEAMREASGQPAEPEPEPEAASTPSPLAGWGDVDPDIPEPPPAPREDLSAVTTAVMEPVRLPTPAPAPAPAPPAAIPTPTALEIEMPDAEPALGFEPTTVGGGGRPSGASTALTLDGLDDAFGAAEPAPAAPKSASPTPMSLDAFPPLDATPMSTPAIPPLDATPISSAAIPPLDATPISAPAIPPLDATPMSIPAIRPLDATPLSSPAVGSGPAGGGDAIGTSMSEIESLFDEPAPAPAPAPKAFDDHHEPLPPLEEEASAEVDAAFDTPPVGMPAVEYRQTPPPSASLDDFSASKTLAFEPPVAGLHDEMDASAEAAPSTFEEAPTASKPVGSGALPPVHDPFAEPEEEAPSVVGDVDGFQPMEFVPPGGAAEAVADLEPTTAVPDRETGYAGYDDARAATPQEPPAAFVTETMAELYLQQGFRDEAIGVYRQLVAQSPDDANLRERLRLLETGARSSMAVTPVAAPPVSVTRRTPQGPSARSVFAALAKRRPSGSHRRVTPMASDSVATPDIAPPVTHDGGHDAGWDAGDWSGATAGIPTPSSSASHAPEYSTPASAYDTPASSAPYETAPDYGSAASAYDTPASEYPDATVTATGYVDTLFPGAEVNPHDDMAAAALAGLYAEPAEGAYDAAPIAVETMAAAPQESATPAALDTPAPDESAPSILSGAPAHRATNELSLDHVFSDAPRGGGSRRVSASFSFDQFFDSAPRVAEAPPAAESAPEPGHDLEQFTAWLDGLKKK